MSIAFGSQYFPYQFFNPTEFSFLWISKEAEPFAESVRYDFLAFWRNASLEAFWLPWEPGMPYLCFLGTMDTTTIAEICDIMNFMETLLLDSSKP